MNDVFQFKNNIVKTATRERNLALVSADEEDWVPVPAVTVAPIPVPSAPVPPAATVVVGDVVVVVVAGLCDEHNITVAGSAKAAAKRGSQQVRSIIVPVYIAVWQKKILDRN